MLLQQHYREKGFKTYANLISCLLLAEQNNELLMRNSQMRPLGSAPLPDAHATEDNKESNHVQGNGQLAVVETSQIDVDTVEDLLAAGEEMVETMDGTVAHLDEAMAVAVDLLSNPNTRLNQRNTCAIDVEWAIIGLRLVGLSSI